MAVRTKDVKLATTFGNNLLRSPVEFAKLALTLQALSRGRFEAGLGAGWSASDTRAGGIDLPDSPARAGDEPGVKLLADSFYGGFFGPAPKAADALRSLHCDGVDRVTLLPPFAGAVEALSRELLAP